MKKIIILFFSILFIKGIIYAEEMIKLPKPRYKSDFSLEEAINKRRSVRSYKDEPLSLEEVSQLLWAAQGITEVSWGLRTAPSAGALYPLKVYLVVGKVKGLEAGVYEYHPKEHALRKILDKDKREELTIACLNQSYIKESAVSLVFSAIFGRTTQKYGEREIRYVYMEAGHASQNVYLQAEALNLGTVVIGAFNDFQVKKILQLSKEESPLYVMPVGKR